MIEGRVPIDSYTPEKLKNRLIQESYLQECCSKCQFNERRVLDYKVPLILNFKDGNKKNWTLDNLELLCYNHYFLYVGNIFTTKQQLLAQNDDLIRKRDTGLQDRISPRQNLDQVRQ